jgi:hypothetical protein
MDVNLVPSVSLNVNYKENTPKVLFYPQTVFQKKKTIVNKKWYSRDKKYLNKCE